eukprot:3845872-Amphidinium_carterae.1
MSLGSTGTYGCSHSKGNSSASTTSQHAATIASPGHHSSTACPSASLTHTHGNKKPILAKPPPPSPKRNDNTHTSTTKTRSVY